MRHENMKGEFKRSKHEKERERDISEKIALGLHTGAQKPVGDGAFDQRLFNQVFEKQMGNMKFESSPPPPSTSSSQLIVPPFFI